MPSGLFMPNCYCLTGVVPRVLGLLWEVKGSSQIGIEAMWDEEVLSSFASFSPQDTV